MSKILPLDLTGNALTNRVEDEVHLLESINDKNDRVICPLYGTFYVESLEVREAETGEALVLNKDYIVAYHESDYSILTGKDLESLIIVTDPLVGPRIKISYQALGGELVIERDFLYEEISKVDNLEIKYSFDDIVGLPEAYPGDEKHPHEYWQIYGFESLIEVIDMLEPAIIDSKSGLIASITEYMEIYKKLIEEAMDAYDDNLEHLEDFNNPHQDNKDKIGLSEIHNWSLANRIQSMDTENKTNYMGLSGVSSLYKEYIFPVLSEHLTDYNNPHKVTFEQLDLYSREQIDGFYSDRLLKTSPAYNTDLVNGKTVPEFSNEVRTNLAASNIASNTRFHRDRLVSNYQGLNYNGIVFGDGSLKEALDVKPPNLDQGAKWILHPGIANSEAMAWSTVVGYPGEVGEIIFKNFWRTMTPFDTVVNYVVGRKEAGGGTTRLI